MVHLTFPPCPRDGGLRAVAPESSRGAAGLKAAAARDATGERDRADVDVVPRWAVDR